MKPCSHKDMFSSRRRFLKQAGTLLVLFPIGQWLSFFGGRNREEGFPIHYPGMMASKKSKPTEASSFTPGYLRLHQSGELKRRGEILWQMMDICRLCPRECETRRLKGQKGDCGSTSRLEVSSFHPHFGEEEPLVGSGGSGTIFLTHCSLRCVYCINWQISMGGEGHARSIDELAQMMLRLQQMGCKNINVVTPTHYSPHIVLALDKAAEKGLRIPLVYNTSGYERLEVLRLLDGVVDIYLPDFKYFDGAMAHKYSSEARDYPERARTALKEMHRQVGVANPAEDGIMYRGLMIRHLVLPNGISGTEQVVQWVAENLSKDTWFHLMAQYTPSYKAHQFKELSRRITRAEHQSAIEQAREAGLTNLHVQDG